MQENTHVKKTAIIFITLELAVVIFFGFQKGGYFVDEISSYNLANSYFVRANSSTGILYDKWVEPQYLSSLIVVSTEKRFAYNSVFFNQSNDVHPPLYYVLLHTICSFFPDSFSKWYGLSINFVLFATCSFFIYLISKKIFTDQFITYLPSLVWGFSAGAISAAMFIRMYMLLTTIIVIYIYTNLILIDSEESIIPYLISGILTILGFLTHYYFLIFAFFWSITYIVYFLIQKKMKLFLRYILINLIALFIGVLIFPSSIYHLLIGYRGKEVVNNLTTYDNYFERLIIMLKKLSSQQFGGILHYLILFLLCLLVIKFFKKIISNQFNNTRRNPLNRFLIKETVPKILYFYLRHIRLFSLAFSVILTFIVIVIASPYLTTRYIYMIYPIISLLSVYSIYQIFTLYISSKRKATLLAFIVFATIIPLTYHMNQIEHLYKGYEENLSTAQNFSNLDCIYISEHDWKVYSNILELMQCKKTYVLQPNDITQLSGFLSSYTEENGLILFVESDLNQNFILGKFLSLTNYKRSKLINSYHYSMTYLVD